ncbi:MAG: BON domain-containing protein [Chloroflexota bacterium]
MARIAPLKLDSPVCFDDRWTGKVSALDVTENWVVLNVTVSAGALFSQKSVKLPMTAVTSMADGAVKIAATSIKAFAREIPPVAAPARPVSAETPTSRQGMRFAGVLLNTDGNRVEEVLVSRGGKTYRVKVGDAQFEGKNLMFTADLDAMPEYDWDADILADVKRAIAEDRHLQTDEKLRVKPSVEAGVVTLSGNVWVAAAREYVESIVARVHGVISINDEIADDIGIETQIGSALLREGLAHTSVYARSKLGGVIIYGFVPTPRQSEDIQRTIVRIPGVRKVSNQLTISPAPAVRA